MRISNSTSCGLWPAHIGRTIRCDEQGFVLGAETPLIRRARAGGFAVEADAERCLALLSVVCRRAVGAELLVPLQAAAKHWQSGDKALANLRLIFAGLPALEEAADAYRLRAAAYCLDHGLAPRELMTALDLDPAVMDLRKFDPDQPRVPAGHGRESGQWTDGGAGGAASAAPASLKADRPPAPKADRPPARRSPVPPSGAIRHIVQVAADGPLKPGGIQVVPRFGFDPLDPKGLNTPLSFKEQQTIADTVNMIVAARPEDIPTLNPHEYKNRPDFGTGAVLPDSVGGYTTYYVRSPGGKAGEARIVMDKYFRIYYSNNHYKSFYPVDVRATPNK